jgi:starvation-inducible DNA-binding protein
VIKETQNVTEGRVAIENIVNALHSLLKIEREILSLSAEANDEGTNALMSDYIRLQEKWVWMYTAWLK